MKFFKKSKLFVILGMILAGSMGVANAATTVCFNTNITRVGAVSAPNTETGNSGVRFEVNGGTCSLGNNTPFFLHTDVGTTGLAMLLSAFLDKRTVTMILDSPPAANGLVYKIHVDG